MRRSQKRVTKLQQKLARGKKGSHRRAKTKKQLAKLHRKIRNQRKDFLHKASRTLVNAYGTLIFEKLHPAHMTHRPKPKQDEETGKYLPNGAAAKAGLNKSILDAGWSLSSILTLPHFSCSAITLSHEKPTQKSIERSFHRKMVSPHWEGVYCPPKPILDTFSLLLSTKSAEEPNHFTVPLAGISSSSIAPTKRKKLVGAC